ncbi:MAG: hypothetical protein KZY74_15490, partial [Paenibacillaceae bacterium]|nr:hypothetical protein [Paenibacillaceae bacterium]
DQPSGGALDRIAERPLVHQTGYIIWQGERLNIGEQAFLLELEPSTFTKTPKLMEKLEQRGIRTVGNLPASFEELQQYKSVGHKMVTKFWEQLKHELVSHRQHYEREQAAHRSEQALMRLTEEERVTKMLRRLEAKWADWTGPEAAEHSTDRAIQMLYYRWRNQTDGKIATLEETGAAFGISRERVRQIIVRKLKRLQADVSDLTHMLQVACGERRYFCYPFHPECNFAHSVIEQVLSLNQLIYIEELTYWTTYSRHQIDLTFKEIIAWLQRRYTGVVVTSSMLTDDCKEYGANHALPEQVVMLIARDTLRQAGTFGYILANSRKYDIVEMVLRAFPEGVEVHKHSTQLLTMANGLSGGQFESVRELLSVLQRDEFRATAYLWSRCTYIHHSYVQVDLVLLREIIEQVNDRFNKRSARSMQDFFAIESSRLQQAGIPNEQVLYGVIRRHCSDLIEHYSFPVIWFK